MTRLLFQIFHNPNSLDPFRIWSAENSGRVLKHYGTRCEPKNIYPNSERDLEESLNRLPSKAFPPKYYDYFADTPMKVSAEVAISRWQTWSQLDKLLPESFSETFFHFYNYRRFALCLAQWLTFETFIFSDYDFLLLLEDDIEMGVNFIPNLQLVLTTLPPDWDVFNFVTPRSQKKNFKPWMQLSNTKISMSYMDRPSAALLFSKVGAKKTLWKSLFETHEKDNLSFCSNIDAIVHNVSLWIEETKIGFHIDTSRKRFFNSFSFVPEVNTGVNWREGFSTVQP